MCKTSIGKLNGKKDRLSGQLQKLQDAAAKEDYTTKVPEDVRQQNSQKVTSIERYFLVNKDGKHNALHGVYVNVC